MPLSSQAVDGLKTLIDNAVTRDPKHIPGTTVVVVDRNGDELLAYSAGKRGISSAESMTLDNIFWIASCTKVVTGMACMQLVEKDQLKLDDAEHLAKLCPELADLKVLTPGGRLEDQKRPITLRMLLTHTAGFGYAFFNERLRDWSHPTGLDEFSGSLRDVIQPLLFQPGEGWEYGVGIDWAGIALERQTKTSLNDYIQQHICRPLGLQNVTMFPTASMKANLAYMHQKTPSGETTHRDHPLHRALTAQTPEEITACLNSGGAGLFAKPQEYARLLSVLLNSGTDPKTQTQLLAPETVDAMFENQIPAFPDFGRQGVAAAKPDLTSSLPQLYPEPGDPPQGWGLTFMLSGGTTGRSKGTAWWAGLPNLFWWCDRENGVAGIVCSQILPFGDPAVLGLWAEVESAVYSGLGVKGK